MFAHSHTGLQGPEWGVITATSWGVKEATVVCRMLGFSSEGATPYLYGYFGWASDLKIWLEDVNCLGNEGR